VVSNLNVNISDMCSDEFFSGFCSLSCSNLDISRREIIDVVDTMPFAVGLLF